MARGLNVLFGPAPRRGRRAAWALLVLGVVGVHGCVTQGVADRMADLGAEAAMPPRMEVAYVREMALSAPAPTAAPAAPPSVATPAAATPRVRKPKPPKPPKAASAPEPRTEPAEVVAAAASEPAASAAPAQAVASEAPVAIAAAPASAASAVSPGADTAVAAALPASAASGVGAEPGGRPFEWPVSTRMTYLLSGNYRGEVSGNAQVEWIRSGSRYEVHVDFSVGPSFAPIITQRSTSAGEITAAGLAPNRYDQEVRVLMTNRPRQTVVFEPDRVVLATGERRERLPGLQDSASQFVQMTYLFSTRPELLRIGGRVDIPLALPKKVALWTYDVVAEEVLNTPFGPVTGIHLKPRINDQKAGTLSVEMWMAPQLRYLPARLRFEQDAQTYVDLNIAKPPEIAHLNRRAKAGATVAHQTEESTT